MASRYPSQTFELYTNPQWPINSKSSAYAEDEESSVLDETVLDPTSPTGSSAPPAMSRRASMIKREDSYYPADNMWHEGMQDGSRRQVQHHQHPSLPHISTNHHPYMRIDPNYAAAYTNPQGWPMSSTSGTSTPTPLFSPAGYESSRHGPFHNAPTSFTPVNQQDLAAIAMSPQSSQGGWGSTASSDSTEHHLRLRSPSHRAVSPRSAIRPDGIRKKNARFEIPQDRNLHNIDSLIMASTDELERKELKQQKRLLRNRQAALDSRQRKKTHTEKLEQEKKIWSDEKQALEDNLQHAHEHYQHIEMQMRHYEQYTREVEFQRDETIRTKTTETTELRRQINALKDMVRDLERQRAFQQYSAAENNAHNQQNTFTPDYTSFDNLGLDDTWTEDGFSLVNNEDYKMENSHSNPQQQATPKPTPKPSTDISKDLPFSWNAFYMCLLFGAFIASKSNSSNTSSIQASIPALSDDYRAEAGHVLKAVLSSTPGSASNLFPSLQNQHRNNHHHPSIPSTSATPSNLESLHTTLTSPSRHQHLASAFSLSAASYNHITNPEGLNLDSDHDPFYDHHHHPSDIIDPDPKPSRLQSAFSIMQAEQAERERVLNRGGSGERSLLWERVPEKVLRDFREMVGEL